MTIRGGEPVDGIVRAEANKGDPVVVIVRSDVADEVHVHGYDLMADVAPGQAGADRVHGQPHGPLRDRARGPWQADRAADRPSVTLLLPLAHGIGSVTGPSDPAVVGVLRRRRRARAVLRRARRTLADADPRARATTRARSCSRRCAPRALRRTRPRSLRGRLPGGARRRAFRRNEPRPDVHPGALLGRPRPAHDPLRERLGLAQSLARRGRPRRVVLATGRDSSGNRRSPIRSGSVAGRLRSSSSASQRWSSRTRTPPTRGCSRSPSRSTAG